MLSTMKPTQVSSVCSRRSACVAHQRTASHTNTQDVVREIQTMRKLTDAPNVVQYYGAYIVQDFDKQSLVGAAAVSRRARATN